MLMSLYFPNQQVDSQVLHAYEVTQEDVLIKWSEEQKVQKRLDDETLKKLGCSSKEISNVLNNLVEHKDKIYRKVLSKDGRFEINWTPYYSTTLCDLCEPEKEIRDGKGTITNIETKTSIKINGIWMHAVSHHGYFVINENSRIEPQFAYNVLLDPKLF